MKKYIFTETQIKKILDQLINESKKPAIKKKLDKKKTS